MTDEIREVPRRRKLLNLLLILLPIIVVAILVTVDTEPSGNGAKRPQTEGEGGDLLCYVGGTMEPVMRELAAMWQERTGQTVLLDKAGSGENWIKIRATKLGDLNVAHAPYLPPLLYEGLADTGYIVASLHPVIVVQHGNPKNVKGLEDFTRPDLKVGLTSREHSTLGYVYPIMFRKAGIWDEIQERIATGEIHVERSGNAICNQVTPKIASLDAVLVWNAVAAYRRPPFEDEPLVDMIEVAEEFRPDPVADAVTGASPGFERMDPRTIDVTICTLANSKKPNDAAAFAKFVDSAEGREVFKKYGFSTSRNAPGVPIRATRVAQGLDEGKALRVYAGAGLSKPMEEAAVAFHAKTGITVQMDFDGSGILLSRLRLVHQGDLYIPGDIGYLEDAGDLVEDKTMVAYFVPVILVPEGNPDGVRDIQDLLNVKPLVLGNPKACQIGRLCVKLFEKNGIDWETISDPSRTPFQSPTVNMLGVQLQTKQARATIVWDAVAAQYEEETDIVPIPLEKNIVSKVAIGTLSFSRQKELAAQFVDFLTGPEGQAILRKHSYRVDPPE